MMTEKEYETLKEKRDKAKSFMDFYLNSAASVQEGMNGVTGWHYDGLSTADMRAEETDIDMVAHMYCELKKFKTQLEQRGEYWGKIYNALKDEVADAEDELRREEEPIEYDEPDYGISRGERLWPPCEFDFTAMGIGA